MLINGSRKAASAAPGTVQLQALSVSQCEPVEMKLKLNEIKIAFYLVSQYKSLR